MSTAPRPRLRARLAVVVLATGVALTGAGCSGGDDAASPSGSEASLAEPTGAPTLEVEPVTSIGRVTGPLRKQDRRRVEKRVSAVAVRWLTAAYVGGDYPRRGFSDALPGFTPGARDAARRDLGVMSNARIGPRVDQVTPTRIEVEVDLLAVDGNAVAATAHVLTRFEVEGKVSGRYRVAGRLTMTRRDGEWKVFGYDVARGGNR